MRGSGLGRSAEFLDISTIFLPTRRAQWWSEKEELSHKPHLVRVRQVQTIIQVADASYKLRKDVLECRSE